MSMIKKLLPLLYLNAMMASSTQDNLFMPEHKLVNKKVESSEDRERRERCEQMAIEKAKAKRERKALKLAKNARKEK